MDENPPDINGHRREEKNKALCESIKLWRKRAWSWLKACFTVDNLKLFVKILIASSPIIGAFYFLIIEIKTDIQTTVTAVNQIDASITAAVSSMATSLSSANAKSDSQAIVHNNTFPLGSGNATIYHKFQNPVQACWYYAATYRTQHPYTVLWEIFSYDEKLKIRAIASKGIWKAHTCQRDKEVDLEKIEKLIREGDRWREGDSWTKEIVIKEILQIAKDYKSITDIKEMFRKHKKIDDIVGLISKPSKPENESKIRELLTDGDTKNTVGIEQAISDIKKIKKAISDHKKLDEINDKIKNNINRFRIIRLIHEPNTIVKLIGEETINHRLEVTFYTPEDEENIWKKIEENNNIQQNEKLKDNIPKLFIDLEKNEPEIRKLLKENDISNDTVNTMMQTIKNRSDYSHIADAVATYYSTLHFDNEGKITHRRVKKVDEYKYILPERLLSKINESKSESIKIKEWECKSEEIKSSTKEKDANSFSICTIPTEKKPDDASKGDNEKIDDSANDYKNEIKITSGPILAPAKNSEKYIKALLFYLEKRKQLHENLTNDGCGAISVEPDFVTGDRTTGELETPSLVFLCHKNNIRSHVRIMVRENQQQTKEREDKAIQEEVKKREDEIRQEVKKETENKQSSEKQHKG